jgi:site-specific recombinase XerD
VAVAAAASSAYVRGLDESLADRFEGYRGHLETLPLADATRRAYAGRVGGYLAWLAELDPVIRRRQGDPFRHGHARDYTVRDYRTHLVDGRKAKPASVNLTLAALDSFYRWVGLGPARVRRDDLPQAAPRALTVEQTRRLLRAAERAAQAGTTGGVRDRAVVALLLFTGLRIGELAGLNLDDVAVSARKGLVTVRRGKGDRYRQVPLNAEARDALDAWLAKRNHLPGSDGPALLLSLKGQRLSSRAIDLTVRRLAQDADLEASAHTLRHTCLTRLVRAGNDIVLVAELAGHARLETTRRYSLPSDTDRQAAMDALTIEY